MRCSRSAKMIVCSMIAFVPLASRGLAEEATPSIRMVVGQFLPEEGGSGDSGSSPLDSPFGIDFDGKGRMFIVELSGGRVHKLDRDGNLTMIAGDGTKGYGGDGGPAKTATFNGMHNVAVTPLGDVYIADSWNHCIRKIDNETGIITSIAGTGEAGFSGDGGPATEAMFDYVMCIALDHANENLYIADLKNYRIRIVNLETGIVNTVAGNGSKGVPKGGEIATASPLVDPRAVAVDSEGKIYILERKGNVLRVVTPDGRIRTVVGTGVSGDRDGPAAMAQLNSPKHICIDEEDNVIIADEKNRLIRKYDPQQATVTTIVGRGKTSPPVRLSRPHGVCFDRGKLYVVDTGNDRILEIIPAAQ